MKRLVEVSASFAPTLDSNVVLDLEKSPPFPFTDSGAVEGLGGSSISGRLESVLLPRPRLLCWNLIAVGIEKSIDPRDNLPSRPTSASMVSLHL